MCLFGLCLFVHEVVVMALVVWGVMKFGGVVVVGWFSCRRIYGRGGNVFESVGLCCCGCGNRSGRCNCG
jgi:hypothetical protein